MLREEFSWVPPMDKESYRVRNETCGLYHKHHEGASKLSPQKKALGFSGTNERTARGALIFSD